MPKIKQLRVKHVRGIVDGPPLDFGKDGVILCGGNGTGKSSYVDAIEKVLTGTCRSLEFGDQSVSWTRHGANLAGEPEVALVVEDNATSVAIGLDADPDAFAPPIRRFLGAAQQGAFVLRRRALLDFIDAKPADKYKIIQQFLELDAFTAFEAKLKALHRQACTDAAAAHETADRHEDLLRAQLKLAPSLPLTEPALVQRANASLAACGVAPMAALAELASRAAELDRRRAALGDADAWRRIEALRVRAAALPGQAAVRDAVDAYGLARGECRAEEARLKGHFYAQVLEQGASWIEQDALERCPVRATPDAATTRSPCCHGQQPPCPTRAPPGWPHRQARMPRPRNASRNSIRPRRGSPSCRGLSVTTRMLARSMPRR